MDGYHTNQDGQWKTSDQWRAEEANTSNKKPKKSGRGKYAAKLVASAVAFGLIAGLVMQGVTYGFSKAGIGKYGNLVKSAGPNRYSGLCRTGSSPDPNRLCADTDVPGCAWRIWIWQSAD